MHPHRFAVVLGDFLLLLALSPAAFAQDEILAPGFANGIPYLSGGIGDEEREVRWSRSFGQSPGRNKLRPVPGIWF
jgi:hypothetical protein